MVLKLFAFSVNLPSASTEEVVTLGASQTSCQLETLEKAEIFQPADHDTTPPHSHFELTVNFCRGFHEACTK